MAERRDGVSRRERVRASVLGAQTRLSGYDDVTFAGELAVPLSPVQQPTLEDVFLAIVGDDGTAVRQPTYQLGWQAPDLLLASRTPRQIVFQPELVARASTGVAPSGLSSAQAM